MKEVKAVNTAGQDTLAAVQLMHVIFLIGVAADSIARQKVAEWPGVRAYLACGWCLFEGSSPQGSSATRFFGYASPAPQSLLQFPDSLVGAEHLQLSDQAQRERSAAVDMYHQDRLHPAAVAPKYAGCNGTSVLVKGLDYVDYNDLFMLPIYHAGEHLLHACVIINVCATDKQVFAFSV